MFVLLGVLLVLVASMIVSRRKKVSRQREAEVQAARLRALRKPPVPFVSASLRGSPPPESPKS